MQTIHFQCGHCGKLMGVVSEFIGQQVRCPHCQQVVIAPPPPTEAAPPPPSLGETIIHVPTPAADIDDIFSPPAPSDDLFGHTEPPRIEMPPLDLLAPTLADSSVRPPEPLPEPTVTSTVPLWPPDAAPPSPFRDDGTAILPSASSDAPWMTGTITEALPPSPPATPAEPESLGGPSAPSAPRPLRHAESGTPWFLILVFSPLLLYSIVITIFAVLLYRHERELEQKLHNRFEMMPDEGDNPGVQKGKKVSRVYHYDSKFATAPLPPHLITALDKKRGESIRIGELQVTPTRVERQRVSVFVEGAERPEPCTGDSLVLYLSMKNLSSEYAFAPLDNYFDRYWKAGMDPPLTQLQAGDHRFYGGPAKWLPRGTKKERREWVQGRKPFEPELLQPGEEKEFFVCTDGQDPRAVLTLFGENRGEKVKEPYHGTLFWRVRVRRGLMKIEDKEYSTTAVIGVKFTDKDIQSARAAAAEQRAAVLARAERPLGTGFLPVKVKKVGLPSSQRRTIFNIKDRCNAVPSLADPP